MNFVDNMPIFHTQKKMSHDTSHVEWVHWIKYLGQESMETGIQLMNGKSYCNYLWSVPRQVEHKETQTEPWGTPQGSGNQWDLGKIVGKSWKTNKLKKKLAIVRDRRAFFWNISILSISHNLYLHNHIFDTCKTSQVLSTLLAFIFFIFWRN